MDPWFHKLHATWHPSLRDNVTLICFLHLGLLQSHLLSHFAFNKLSHIAADVIPIPQMSNLSPLPSGSVWEETRSQNRQKFDWNKWWALKWDIHQDSPSVSDIMMCVLIFKTTSPGIDVIREVGMPRMVYLVELSKTQVSPTLFP